MMHKSTFFAATLLMLPVTLAQATPNAYDDVLALNAQADEAYAQGDYYAERGENDNACYFYKKASGYWQDGIWAAVGIGRDVNSGDTAKRAIDGLSVSKKMADDRAASVCGKPNGPNLSPSSGSNGYDGNGSKSNDMLAFEALVKSGIKSGNAAYDFYEAGNYAEACAQSKLAAKALTSASWQLKQNPSLGDGSANPGRVHVDARDIVELRDTVYCAH